MLKNSFVLSLFYMATSFVYSAIPVEMLAINSFCQTSNSCKTIGLPNIKLISSYNYVLNDIRYNDKNFTIDDFSLFAGEGDRYNIRCVSSIDYDAFCSRVDNAIANADFSRYLAYKVIYQQKTVEAAHLLLKNQHQKLSNIMNNQQNGMFDMTTYTRYQGYPEKGEYNSGQNEIWVTLTEELKKKISQDICPFHPDEAQAAIMFNQLLGLAPDKEPRYFVSMKVPAKESYENNGVFRPCLNDYTLTSHQCALGLSHWRKKLSKYNDWVLEQYHWAYQSGHDVPWTGQGYTYDWGENNSNHFGLPEYVIAKKTKLIIYQKQTVQEMTQEVCQQ